MGVSGYVVSPYGEDRQYLGRDRCQITMVLQVDPRVGDWLKPAIIAVREPLLYYQCHSN